MRSDTEIIHNVLNLGDINAYRHLVDKYKGLVFTICYRIVKNREDAEELTQDIFVKGYQSLSKLKEPHKFKGWIMRIAYTKSIDKIRLTQHHTAPLNSIDQELILDKTTPFSILNKNDRTKLIKKSLAKLPGDEAAVMTLYYLEDQSIQKVGEFLNITLSNVKVKLFRARKRLIHFLPEELKDT